MENSPTTPEPGSRLRRRTVVSGAAWTIPVAAVVAAAPLASASVPLLPWNVSITPSCVTDTAGTGFVAPGFLVNADPGTLPIPASLAVTETAAGSWSMTLPAPVLLGVTTDPTLLPGFDVAYGAFSLAYASAIVAAVLVPGALAVDGPKVDGDFWVTPSNVGDYLSPPTVSRTYSGAGLQRTVTMTVTWDIARALTLNGLVPGDSTYWGYFGALVPPDVTGVPGYALLDSIVNGVALVPVVGPIISSGWNTAVGSLSPELSMTAVGQWTDANADHTANLTNLFAFTCN